MTENAVFENDYRLCVCLTTHRLHDYKVLGTKLGREVWVEHGNAFNVSGRIMTKSKISIIQ